MKVAGRIYFADEHGLTKFVHAGHIQRKEAAKTENVTFKRWNGPLPALQKSFIQKAIALDNKQCSGED